MSIFYLQTTNLLCITFMDTILDYVKTGGEIPKQLKIVKKNCEKAQQENFVIVRREKLNTKQQQKLEDRKQNKEKGNKVQNR